MEPPFKALDAEAGLPVLLRFRESRPWSHQSLLLPSNPRIDWSVTETEGFACPKDL